MNNKHPSHSEMSVVEKENNSNDFIDVRHSRELVFLHIFLHILIIETIGSHPFKLPEREEVIE